jgi:hypothetical protein
MRSIRARTTTVRWAVVCGSLLVPLSACGLPPTEADLQTNYTTLDQLSDASVDVVTLTTEESRVEGNPETGDVMTQAVVLSSGKQHVTVGDRVEIMQPAIEFSNTVPVLSVGETYAVFLVPCDPEGTEALPCYQITGSVGAWEVDDGVGKLVAPRSDLPGKIDVSDDSGVLDVRARG